MYIARSLHQALDAPNKTVEVHLGGGDLDALPPELFDLPNLRVLKVGQNRLIGLPSAIGQCTQLQTLVLDHNSLRSLPPEIGQLRHLRLLDLGDNQLQELPAELQHCEALRDLRLRNNQFQQWPTEALPPGIESISLAHNQVATLPASIRHLTGLKYLDIAFNRLTDLPECIVLLEQLKFIYLSGNPLSLAIPSHDPEEEWERLLPHLRAPRYNAGERQRWLRLLLGDVRLRDEEEPHLLAAALDSPIAQVRQAAKLLLPTWFPSPLPAKGPAKLAFVGHVAARRQYQGALTAADIHLQLRPEADTIAILGDRPGQQGSQAFAMGARIGYEGHLEAWAQQRQGTFLKPQALSQPLMENLRRLIRSHRKENIEIALVMMAKAGCPDDLMTELLGIRLFHPDPEVQGMARKAFDELAQKDLRTFTDRQITKHHGSQHDLLALVTALLRNPAIHASALVGAALSMAGGGLELALLLPEAEQGPHFQSKVEDGYLKLSNLGLAQLPAALAEVSGLQTLVLSRNQIASLPADLRPLAGLTILDLEENKLTALPEQLDALAGLKGLSLARNRLRQLPDSIGRMQGLEALRLDHNPLAGLPDSLADLPHLEVLSVHGCKFPQFPEVVWRMGTLDSLYLTDCNLRTLPDEAPRCARLTTLVLRENPIERLPEWIGHLQALRFLELSLLPARRLPESLQGHARLERIYLIRDDSMDWEQVLPLLRSMPRLRHVYLRGRKLVRQMQLHIEEQLPRMKVYWGG